LLRRVCPHFRIVPAHIQEQVNASFSPAKLVQFLALQKARHVAARLSIREAGNWVLGADTLVFLGDKVLGKPAGATGARRMLQALSGTWHRVYTGVALVQAGTSRREVGYQLTRVKMRKLSFRQIDAACRNHLDKAGAYAIQEKGDPFVEVLHGDYDNVVGLPLRLVGKFLKQAGFKGFSVPKKQQ
jgi:septum formation protein